MNNMNRNTTILLIATCLLASAHLTLGQNEGSKCSRRLECDDHLKCHHGRCVDPCLGACGLNAECKITRNFLICRCPPNYTGNPFEICSRLGLEPEEQCQPNACGPNTICKVINGTPKCSCLREYIGDPLSGCRHECGSNGNCGIRNECESNEDCGSEGCCTNSECYPEASCRGDLRRIDSVRVDPEHPCDPDPCSKNEICHDKNGKAFCACRYHPFYRLPESGCNSECSTKIDCPSNKTCIRAKCVDSCPGDCSPNEECYVFDHEASCRPKDSRPECTSNNDCPSDKACDGYKCVDPCRKHCVENADCQIVNLQPICTCKKGFYEVGHQCYLHGTIVE